MISSRVIKFNSRQRPIGVDLFAGAGGLSLGFEQAGFDVVAAVEIDPIHSAIHEFNFPNCTTICRSVTAINGQDIRRLAGIGNAEIDVVFGGAPCQGFSMIGKRALDDPRNELVHHFVRLVAELSPRYFVFENVKGLTVGNHKRFLNEIIDAFIDNGYDVVEQYRVLNAADYGVPQDRKRLFLMGARKGLSLPSYSEFTFSTSVWDAIGDLPNADDFPELLKRDWVETTYETTSDYGKRLKAEIEDASDFSQSRKFDRRLLTSSLRTEHTPLSQERFAQTPFGKTEPVSRFFKLDPKGVCNTLRAGTASDRGAFTSPRPIHPFHPRVITVREAARLHSYPDWFRFHVTKWHGFRQIGNSVPPLLGRAVASSIMVELGVIPARQTRESALGHEGLLSFSMSEAADFFEVSRSVIPQRKRQPERECANG